MNREALFTRFEELAARPEPNGGKLHDIAEVLGSDYDGLQAMVERYGQSENVILLGHVAHALSHAAYWRERDRRLLELVLDFLPPASPLPDRFLLNGYLNIITSHLRDGEPPSRQKPQVCSW